MRKKKADGIEIAAGQPVELATLGQGTLRDVFARDLERILQNITDDSTSPGITRIYNVKLKLKPTDDRSAARVEIETSMRLAPEKPVVTAFLFSKEGRRILATESAEAKQGTLGEMHEDDGIETTADAG